MKKSTKVIIGGIASSILGVFAAITALLFRKSQTEPGIAKLFPHKRQKIYLYPQDVILKKTLLKIIPESITPNQVSILRIILTPLAAFLIAYGNDMMTALAVFLFVSFTDMIDGAMARVRDQITSFGKIIDPIADKLLIIFCAILLLPKFGYGILLLIIIAAEILNLVIAGLSFKNKNEVSANIFGKIKMCLQVFGIALFLIHNYHPERQLAENGVIALIVSLVFNFSSLLYYIFTRKAGI